MDGNTINKIIGVALLIYAFVINPILLISVFLALIVAEFLILIIISKDENFAKMIMFSDELPEDTDRKIRNLMFVITGIFLSFTVMLYRCFTMLNL